MDSQFVKKTFNESPHRKGAEESRKVLAGDVGGTKTDLGLFSVEGCRLRTVREERFINKDYKGPGDVIKEFLGSNSAREIAAATLGVAAPVEGNKASLTNISWIIDGEDIKERFGIKKVELINDLVATGWGLPLLSTGDLVVLQQGMPRKGNAALIAAGTGLGETILFWDGTTLTPSASEGGHTDFAPRDPIETGLLEFLIKRYGHVSYERVLSGTGLKNIYDFLKESKGLKESPGLNERFEKEDPASVISDEAEKGGDETCREALESFISIYGAEAGNLALKAMAVGGVYVGGGIAPKIIKPLKKGGFMEAFTFKGRFKGFLTNIPVYVILNARTALLGAAHHAARSISKMEYTLG
jgi:glucokinase